VYSIELSPGTCLAITKTWYPASSSDIDIWRPVTPALRSFRQQDRIETWSETITQSLQRLYFRTSSRLLLLEDVCREDRFMYLSDLLSVDEAAFEAFLVRLTELGWKESINAQPQKAAHCREGLHTASLDSLTLSPVKFPGFGRILQINRIHP